VTGGGRGIGAAVARALANEGCAIVVAARSGAEIEAVTTALRSGGAEAWGIKCDVADPGSIQALADEATGRLGRVDILVNNAGVASAAPVHKQTLDEWNRLLAVNATGTFLCTQALLPGMVEHGWGRVVNIASVAGVGGAAYISAYAASKHAVVGFTRSAAVEVAERGVTVNAVCPGYVDTPMTEASIASIVEKTGMSGADALEVILATSPQKRLITPEEVAYMVVSLCREAAGSINGQALVIDGGGFLR
jgi:3-hydroxybutyrate dehydrogenase